MNTSFFSKNESNLDRGIRVVVGIALTVAAVYTSQWWLLILAAVALITAATGFCGLYKVFGISTCSVKK